MQKLKLSDKLAARLKSFGWEGSSTMDVNSCAAKLKERYGLEMPENARLFLETFGGLTLQDKEGILVYLTPGKVKTRERRGQISWGNPNLYPIGYLRDTTLILMDEKGATYSFWDHLIPFADNPIATLEKFTESIYGG